MIRTILQRTFFFSRLFLLPHLPLFIAALFTGFIVAGSSGLGIPVMVKYVFPVVFYTGAPGEEVPKVFEYLPQLREMQLEQPALVLLMACAVLPLVFLVRGLGIWLNGMVVTVLSLRISASLRMKLFTKVMSLPLALLERRQKGDILSRIMNDTGTVLSVLTSVANDLFKQPITCLTAICTFLFMMAQSGESGILVLDMVLIGLAAWPIIHFGQRISKRALQASTDYGRLNTVVQQNLEAIREVRAYAMEDRQIREFNDVADSLCRNSLKMIKYQRAVIPIMEVVTSIALAVLLVHGRESNMRLSDFLALAAVLFIAFDSMKKAGNTLNRLNGAQGPLQRVQEVLTTENTMPDPQQPIELPRRVSGDILFRDVSFEYTPGNPVLHDVNVHIPAGQVVGLVGSSGAGKTTFASLIPRFYDVTRGAVLIDGIDVRDVRVKDLRDQLSLVGQHALLFSGTISDNIALGNPEATDAEIQTAADAAAVTSFLATQPAGMKTKVGESGNGLSGGQRQRVAIARAFVKNAPILILDEATASLDAESESDIQRELESLSQGRTTLIVAHRFSTLRHAQRILLFEHGRIIADGTHEELYATSPLYKELYDRQGLDDADPSQSPSPDRTDNALCESGITNASDFWGTDSGKSEV